MPTLSSVFLIFFITLGPIKTIAPFVQLTAGTDAAHCRRVALRAALASTFVVLVLAMVGPLILENWGVSFTAVALTGGVILFLTSLQVMLAPTESASVRSEAPATLSTAMLISRLVIPTIVTPSGIAAILALVVLSEGNNQLRLQIVGLLVAVMVFNMIIMLSARRVMALLTVAGLRVIGWVFAVLQASLGAQIIINALRRLGTLPMQ